MHLGAIDTSAVMGRSWLHRADARIKLVGLALTLAAVVVSWNVLVILGVLLTLAAGVHSALLNPRLTYGLAGYPAVFAIVFAASSAPDVLMGTTIVLKAVTAALAAVVVVLTTPYPLVFAPIQRIVPSIVGDALLMTYRSTFLLMEKFANLQRAVHLRSGLSAGHPVRAARDTTRALGGLLLYSFDLAQRDYDIMRLRGYQDRLSPGSHPLVMGAREAVVLVVCGSLLAVSVLWRIGAVSLNPYSWLVPLAATLLLAASVATGRRHR